MSTEENLDRDDDKTRLNDDSGKSSPDETIADHAHDDASDQTQLDDQANLHEVDSESSDPNETPQSEDATIADESLVDDHPPREPESNPTQSARNESSHVDSNSEVAGETLADPDLMREANDPHQDTVFESDESAAPVEVTVSDTMATEEQTVVDNSFVDDSAADSSTDDGSAATIADNEPDQADVGSSQFDQTIADQSLGGPADPQFEHTMPIEGTAPTETSAEEDQTVLEESTADAPSSQPPDPDATQMESGDGGDPDATQMEGRTTESDATHLQEDFDATYVEGESGAGSAANADYSNDATQMGSQQFRGAQPRKPSTAHETADRWELEQRYQLVTNFARGGLGQIWMAQDSRLKREVAYKELLPNALRNKSALERFLEEAQITGQLEHPGIVPIYDIGYQANGTPFYAMKLVRGETMEKNIEEMHKLPAGTPERSLAFRKMLRNFVDVCNAIAFAHDRGVLHRDLKPLNVMLGAFGETLVLDWGLAKIIGSETDENHQSPITSSSSELNIDGETVVEDSELATGLKTGTVGGTAVATAAPGDSSSSVESSTAGRSIVGESEHSGTFGSTKRMVVTDVRTAGSQTMTGSVMGTPAYMPPEQAKGDIETLDERCDIYSLGGILYKILTNFQPIARGKIKQVLKDVKEGNIVPPRKRDETIDKPLEAVCMKALATSKEDRYRSALDLAADVEAWLADEPVSVFEDPFTVRFRRWRKRHRTAVTSTTVACVLLFVVWGFSSYSHAKRLDSLRAQFASADMASIEALDDGDFDKAEDVLVNARGAVENEPELEHLVQALNSKLDLVESRRISDLRRKFSSRLDAVEVHLTNNRLEEADKALPELSDRVKEDLGNQLVSRFVDLQTKITQRLAIVADIADTERRFKQFLTLAEDARVYGNQDTLSGLADRDAELAIKKAQEALELMHLDGPEPQMPPYASQEYRWAQVYQQDHGTWPEEAIKQTWFEMVMLLGNKKYHLAKNLADQDHKNAVNEAIELIDRAMNGLQGASIGKFAALAKKVDIYQAEGRKEFAVAKQKLVEMQPSTFHDFFLLGNELRLQLRTDDAITQYLKALTRKPGDFWTLQYLGLCSARLGDNQAALAYFSSCLAARPGFVWTHIYRGNCYRNLGKYQLALAEYAAALEAKPDLPHILMSRGGVHFLEGDFESARKDFNALEKLVTKGKELTTKDKLKLPNEEKDLIAKAKVNLALVNLEEAKRIRRGVSPFDELNDLDRLQQENIRVERALAALDEAEALIPTNSQVYELKARAFDRQGRRLEARANFRKSLDRELDPSRKCVALKRLANIEFNELKHKEALALFVEAQRVYPRDNESLYFIAECHLQLGNNEEALRYYDEFLNRLRFDLKAELNPPEVLFNGMALANYKLGRQDSAMQYYSLALMFKKDHSHSLTRRGWSYVMNSMVLAEKDFRKSIKADENDADAHMGLAYALVQQQLQQPRRKTLLEALRVVSKGEDLAKKRIEAEAKKGEKGDVGQFYALYHNAATVYAQAMQLVAGNQENEIQLAKKALSCLALAFETTQQDPKIRTQMIRDMELDSALTPLKIRAKSAFENLLTQFKNSGAIQ